MVKKDYVIGIDCSTSASKAIVWDKDGNCIAEGRSEIPLLVPKPEQAMRHGNDLFFQHFYSPKARGFNLHSDSSGSWPHVLLAASKVPLLP